MRRGHARPHWQGFWQSKHRAPGSRQHQCGLGERGDHRDNRRLRSPLTRRAFGKDSYRYDTFLQHAGGDYEIDFSATSTPIGAISRLEDALGGFEHERENCRNRLADAKRRLASYAPRQGESFSFEAERELKLTQLNDIERDLAATADEPEEDRQEAACTAAYPPRLETEMVDTHLSVITRFDSFLQWRLPRV
ncbi:MAG: hypothetical protein ABW048_00920 [Sphingobium sp.]